MPLTIEMADGSKLSKDGTEGVTAGAELAKGPVQYVPARTRLQIAQELDAAESKLKASLESIVALRADVSRLEKELREFGVKKRGPRKGKE